MHKRAPKSRRDFLRNAGSGIGAYALASLLEQDKDWMQSRKDTRYKVQPFTVHLSLAIILEILHLVVTQ